MLHDSNKLEIKEIQTELMNLLIIIDDIFSNNNIRYFLSFGTLLGSIRHNGFIPWDDDIDLHIDSCDFDKAILLLKQGMPKRYYFFDTERNELSWDIDERICDSETIVSNTGEGVMCKNACGLFVDLFKMDFIKTHNRFIYSLTKFLKNRMRINSRGMTLPMVIKFIQNKLMYLIVLNIFKFLELIPNKRKYVVSDKWFGGMFDYSDIYPFEKKLFNGRFFNCPSNYKLVLTYFYGDYSKIPDERKIHFNSCYRIK